MAETIDGGNAQPALDEVVCTRDLILVTGKGGVGKSTVVAALARLAARRRGGAVAVEVSAQPRLPGLIRADRRIKLVNIELEKALPRVLSRLLRVPTLITSMVSNRVLQLFVRTSPAVRETILLDELYELVGTHGKKGRPVIVDLPATGHAVSLLDTPRSVRRMLRVGPVANKAALIEELLLDARRVELVVVALPEELPVNETIELVRRASELGLASRTVVVNQVPVGVVEEADRNMIALLHAQDDADLHAAAGAAESDLDGVGEARDQIARLRDQLGDRVIEVPLCQHHDPIDRAAAIERSLAS